MEKEEQIKVAITAGIVALILLILILFLALSGGKKNKDKELSDNITEVASLDGSRNASSAAASSKDDASGVTSSSAASSSSADKTTDQAADGKSSVAYSEYLQTAKGDVSGNSFYATNDPLLKDVYQYVQFDIDSQLQEMSTYWADGNEEAVRDLAHLERFEAMSYSLKGTADFYYYGDLDDQGRPSGKGLAVYADDQYYYGDWAEGARSGKGSWFAFYPLYSNYVVTEHMYSGSWSGDKPNGEGQEHFDYNPEFMNLQDVYLQNAIGSYENGLYNGDMYIINVDKNGDTDEWLGTCHAGTFDRVNGMANDKKGNVPVLRMRQNEKTLFYMAESKNKNLGVKGLITGGTVKK